MTFCNCSLPALYGNDKCCEFCTNNPSRTYEVSFKGTYALPVSLMKPLRKCKYCLVEFMSDVANFCPNCGANIEEKVKE